MKTAEQIKERIANYKKELDLLKPSRLAKLSVNDTIRFDNTMHKVTELRWVLANEKIKTRVVTHRIRN